MSNGCGLVSGTSSANTRGDEWKDRWAVGAHDEGAWAVVADGISTDPAGAEAAQTAVSVCARMLTGSALRESDVLSAVDTACSAVEPWYDQHRPGGTTITIAAVSQNSLVICSLGDTAVYLGRDGTLTRVTPGALPHGRLGQWAGMLPRTQPWLSSRTWDCSIDGPVVVASDGIDLSDTQLPPLSYDLPSSLLRIGERQHGDDATVAVVNWHGTGGGLE